MNRLIVFLLIASAPSIGCCEGIKYLIWGKYCGECVGDCSVMYKITSSTLEVDSSNTFLEQGYTNYVFSGKAVSSELAAQFSWLLNAQWPVMTSSVTVIGEPDAHDQCGYYLNYQLNGKSYKVFIDPMQKNHEFNSVLTKLFDGM